MSDTFVTLCTMAHQASLSMGFTRQKYWSGLPFSSPKYLTDPGIKLASPVSPAWQVDSLPLRYLKGISPWFSGNPTLLNNDYTKVYPLKII